MHTNSGGIAIWKLHVCLYNAYVLSMKYAHLAVHNAHSITANSSGANTWLVGLGVQEWGKLRIHMAVGLAIWAPVISLVWYVCWSLDNCQTEALTLLYAS